MLSSPNSRPSPQPQLTVPSSNSLKSEKPTQSPLYCRSQPPSLKPPSIPSSPNYKNWALPSPPPSLMMNTTKPKLKLNTKKSKEKSPKPSNTSPPLKLKTRLPSPKNKTLSLYKKRDTPKTPNVLPTPPSKSQLTPTKSPNKKPITPPPLKEEPLKSPSSNKLSKSLPRTKNS